LPEQRTVISTEDAHSLTVSIAVEKSASLPLDFPGQPFAVAFALLYVVALVCISVAQGFSLGSLKSTKMRGFSPWGMASYPASDFTIGRALQSQEIRSSESAI
jgi:uncharacterized membrane protein